MSRTPGVPEHPPARGRTADSVYPLHITIRLQFSGDSKVGLLEVVSDQSLVGQWST
jgi:hypothetical protein